MPSESVALPKKPQGNLLPSSFPGNRLEPRPVGDGNDSRWIQPIHRCLPESVSGIQDSIALTFEKFRDFIHFISIDAHFTQRFAKVRKKPVEMPVV
jgi:hypothetical protein